MKRPQLYGIEVQPRTCGRMAMENAARYFWQSRMTSAARGVAPLPDLTNLRELAERVRDAFNQPEEPLQC